MIRILRRAAVDGRVDTSQLTDLRYLVSQAEKYKIPDYVRGLAHEVVNGSPANPRYQGAVAGNLTAGKGQAGSLVPAHAGSITGYNAQAYQFQLFNPWGTQQPSAISYSQFSLSLIAP